MLARYARRTVAFPSVAFEEGPAWTMENGQQPEEEEQGTERRNAESEAKIRPRGNERTWSSRGEGTSYAWAVAE